MQVSLTLTNTLFAFFGWRVVDEQLQSGKGFPKHRGGGALVLVRKFGAYTSMYASKSTNSVGRVMGNTLRLHSPNDSNYPGGFARPLVIRYSAYSYNIPGVKILFRDTRRLAVSGSVASLPCMTDFRKPLSHNQFHPLRGQKYAPAARPHTYQPEKRGERTHRIELIRQPCGNVFGFDATASI